MNRNPLYDNYLMIKQRSTLCYYHDIDNLHYEYYEYNNTHITVKIIKDTNYILEIAQRV